MTASRTPTLSPIAVVGVSALFPGSSDAQGFWRDILAGRDLIGDVPPSHWLIDDYYDADPAAPDKTYAKRGAFLNPVDFDALAWGVPPSNIPATDTAQLLALVVAQAVLQDATREQFEQIDRSRISVILGVTSAQELLFSMVSRLQRPVWVKALRESGLPEDEVQAACERIAANYVPWQESSFPGLLGNVVAGRIANRLNLGGTNCVTDAACASSFSALSMAVNELQLGHSDMVIAGGVDTLNDIFMFMCFSKTPALSASGDCRPFSADADGTMLGEGLGMVALKRLDDAERDGDRIYAVIRGVGSSSDGRSKSVYAPVSAGQAQALRRCYEQAGYSADTVELVEAHGTGTKAGDAAEFDGLRLVFDGAAERRQWCALGSVKSQIGHTKAAAGAAGLFKAVMALHHKVLPPSIKIDAPNPKLGLPDSAFYLNTRARPWIRGSAHPRRASVSAFGFGGSNFHVTLEEYSGAAPQAERFAPAASELLAVGADSSSALLEQLRVLRTSSASLARLARSSRQQFRSDAGYRVALVARDVEQLRARLTALIGRIEASPEQAFVLPDGSAYGVATMEGQLGLLFPGQGSQYLNMGAELAMRFPAARAIWDRAADVALDPQDSLHDVVFPRPEFTAEQELQQQQRLTATEWAQPAIAATSMSMLALLSDLGIRAGHVAGHSYGELTALHAAEVVDRDALLRMARRRGELMRDAAAEPGAMIAVNASSQQVAGLIEQHAATVVIANHNAPNQVIVSGALQAIVEFEATLTQQGIGSKRLPVATAFHSELVAGSCAPFAEFLSSVPFKPATATVYSNASAAPYADSAAMRDGLALQIASAVRFVDMIETMYAAGVRCFLEVGPGSVLSGLVASILGERPHQAIALDRRGRDGVESLLLGLARLAAAGVPMQLARLFAGEREAQDPPPRSKHSLQITGSNVGKPYPPQDPKTLPAPNPPRAPLPAPTAVAVTTDIASAPAAAPAPSPASVSVAIPAAALPNDAWVQAFQDSQQQTAAAHAAFQQAMFDSHNAYLRLAESSLGQLAALLAAPQVGQPLAMPPAPMSAPVMALPAAPTFAAPQFASATPAVAAVAMAPAMVAATSPDVADVAAPSVPRTVTAVRVAAIDLQALMLGVVADKTGYPADMLNLDMDLEGDLGIDSIKRVEILAAVDERAPNLPRLDRSHMSGLHTLREIVDYLGAQSGPTAIPGTQATAAPMAAPLDLQALMLGVVADKTGYPADMLNLDMDLEGDLGIDSIKRVEILAAVDERAPNLPKLDRSHMSGLHTLREIVDYLGAQSGSALPAATPAMAAPLDLQALMLGVVADKTGYPADMLNLDMDLEGDLGIDSIKRVEILAAVDERAPNLPRLDRSHMSGLHTLREIVDYLRGQSTDTTPQPVPAAIPAEASRAASLQHDLGRFELQLIAAPRTGLAMPGLLGGARVWITGAAELNQVLADELRRQGVNAQASDAPPATASACVYLGGLRAFADVGQAMAVNREAFALARRVGVAQQSLPGLFVTVQDTGGRFGIGPVEPLRAWSAGLPALVKTAALEWPKAALKAIDLECGGRDARTLAKILADELLHGGGEVEVALPLQGGRFTTRSVATPVLAQSPVLDADDVVIVSGGARGVTAACIIEWARTCPARFVLLGRSALIDEPASCQGATSANELKSRLLADAKAAGETLSPNQLSQRVQAVLGSREIRATLAAIAAAGAQVRYAAVNVEDRAQLGSLLDELRASWGAPRALVHAAGVLADKRIVDKTDAQFDAVFNTKVAGLAALLDACAGDPLKLLCVFSSVSARCGNTGQADYAMANEVLAKVAVAIAQSRPGLRVKSLGWGPWEAGMVSPQLKQRFAELGVPMIPLAVGARMFVDEMADAQPHAIELVLGGEPRAEALLFDGAKARVQSLELKVQRTSHAYLEGHAVKGLPVVPAVLVAEWLSRAARSFRPGLHLKALHEFKVLKGIRLGGFEGEGDRFIIEASPLAAGPGTQLQLLVKDSHGTPFYSARAELADEALQPTQGLPAIELDAWHGEPLYQDLLFHRGKFELIENLHGMSDHGVGATLRGVQQAGWDHEPWQLDVAALDAGLQLAVLYGQRMLGGPNLPTSIDQLRCFGIAPGAGPITATAYRRHVGSAAVTTDILFANSQGQRLAELLGVQNHALPRV